MKKVLFLFLITLTVFDYGYSIAQYWNFPPLPSPEQYGNILINRTSGKNKVLPVTFSHWSHRIEYTCRVCHLELGFNFKLNTTEITEDANQKGRYCGACHDGRTAFGHTRENCNKCHNGDIGYGRQKFVKLKDFPKAKYGNKIDWTKALEGGLIRPRSFLVSGGQQMIFDKTIRLEAEWAMIPPAFFSHKTHARWLDCSNCHPDIFNIKKKTTKHFSMTLNNKGEFCGTCHLRVAFPLNDCKGCHPEIPEQE